MKPHALTVIFPDWWLFWLAVADAVALMLGMIRLAVALGVIPAVRFLVLPMAEQWLDELPVWVLVLGIALFGLFIARAGMALVLGSEGAGQAIGMLFVRFMDLSWRGLSSASRAMRRGLSRSLRPVWRGLSRSLRAVWRSRLRFARAFPRAPLQAVRMIRWTSFR